MKYLLQFGIIAGVSFVAELLYILLPLPVPASVYGLILLFILLMTKVVKVEQVEETADFFMAIMPILFISPSVSLLTSVDVMKGNVAVLLLMTFVSTIAVTSVTGLISQAIIRRKRKKNGGDGNERDVF